MIGNKSARFAGGFSLIGVLVAVAITGILAVLIASLLDTVSQTMRRSRYATEIENRVRLIQAVLDKKETCAVAFRREGGGYITWANTINFTSGTANDQVIVVADPNSAAMSTDLAKVGLVLADTNFGLRTITMERKDGPVAYKKPWPTGTSPQENFNSYTVELNLTFGDTNLATNQVTLGGSFQRRKVTTKVGVRAADNTIRDCPAFEYSLADLQCDPGSNPSNPDVVKYYDQSAPEPNTPQECITAAQTAQSFASTWMSCEVVYYLTKVTSAGDPRCACRVSCRPTAAPPTPAPPPSTGPGTGPGGGPSPPASGY